MSGKLICVRCDKELDDISTYQPNDGLCFMSYGHYGSTVFDPLDGSYLEIVICDECLQKVQKREVNVKYTPNHSNEPEAPEDWVIDWEEVERSLDSMESWNFREQYMMQPIIEDKKDD